MIFFLLSKFKKDEFYKFPLYSHSFSKYVFILRRRPMPINGNWMLIDKSESDIQNGTQRHLNILIIPIEAHLFNLMSLYALVAL